MATKQPPKPPEPEALPKGIKRLPSGSIIACPMRNGRQEWINFKNNADSLDKAIAYVKQFDADATWDKIGGTNQRLKELTKRSSKRTFGDLIEHYLRAKEHTLKPRTMAAYLGLVKHLEELRSVEVETFGREPQAQFLGKLKSKIGGKGKKLSPKMINHITDLICGATRLALEDKLIDSDPFQNFKRQRVPKHHIDPFSKEEINAMLAAMNHDLAVYVRLMLTTGIRTGEVMSLRWSSVRWEDQTIRITASRVKKVEYGPKTKAGERDVFVPPFVLEQLRNMRDGREGVTENDRILVSRDGGEYQAFPYLQFKAALKRAGVRYRDVYECRSTYASLELADGRDIYYVSRQLGHSEVTVTLNRYGAFVKGREHLNRSESAKLWGEIREV